MRVSEDRRICSYIRRSAVSGSRSRQRRDLAYNENIQYQDARLFDARCAEFDIDSHTQLDRKRIAAEKVGAVTVDEPAADDFGTTAKRRPQIRLHGPVHGADPEH